MSGAVNEVGLLGGDGNDTLVAGIDGAGLDGGAGTDTLIGGPGDDLLADDGNGEHDTTDGGPGHDAYSYARRSQPALARLDGGPGEDTLTNIEDLEGGDGSDTLIGNDGPNHLAGDGGNDTLAGLDGRDTLDGGAGSDLLDAGAGDDTIKLGIGDYDRDTTTYTLDPSANEAPRCGAGDDLVIGPAVTDTLGADCELIHEPQITVALQRIQDVLRLTVLRVRPRTTMYIRRPGQPTIARTLRRPRVLDIPFPDSTLSVSVSSKRRGFTLRPDGQGVRARG